MKIYTKTGDDGSTKLFGGKNVSKDDIRVHCYGTIDELNSFIGFTRDQILDVRCRTNLLNIQILLFDIGAHLATESEKAGINNQLPALDVAEIENLEREIDKIQSQLPELKHFILPGGHPAASACHLARSVCRRAERAVVTLAREEEIHEVIIPFLNRLSDYLFVLARYVGRELGVNEIKWEPRG